MSLLDDVSIVVTPNGYKAGELYAVVPVPSEGAELVTDGDFNSSSNWFEGSGCTISGNQGIFTSAPSGSGFTGNNVNAGIFTIGKRYTVVFTIDSINLGALKIRKPFNSSTTYTAAGTYTETVIATDVDIYIQNSGTTTASISYVSVKEYTAADMDVTRATAATRVDEAGLVNYAEIIGSEEITNGDFVTNLDGWILSASTPPTWDNGMIKMQSDGVTFSVADQSFSTISGKLYTFVFEKLINNNTVEVKVGTSQGGSSLLNLTPTTIQTYTYSFIATSSTSWIRARDGSGTTGAYLSGFSVKEVTRDNVPRIDYSGGGCPHILAEPQRTNQITQNNQFDTTWVTSNLGLTRGQNGIYNTTDAWLFNATNSLANVTISVSTSGENTYSVYAKAGTEDGVFIRFTGGSNPRAFFNLTNGTLISESGTTNTNVENVGNGWYRCSITGSETITDARIYVADSSGNFVSSGNIYIQYSPVSYTHLTLPTIYSV